MPASVRSLEQELPAAGVGLSEVICIRSVEKPQDLKGESCAKCLLHSFTLISPVEILFCSWV